MKTVYGILIFITVCLQLKAQIPHSGQVLWLKAGNGYTVDSIGRVSVWKDASGNGYDATQNTASIRPIFIKNAANGWPALRYDGVSTSMVCPSVFPVGTGGYTIFAVLQPHAFSGAYNTIVGGNVSRVFLFGATDHPEVFHAPIFIAASSRTPQPTSFSTTNVIINDTTRIALMYQNGMHTATDVFDTVPNTDSVLYIGSFDGFWNFSGDIAEILIYDHALNLTQVDSINNYLNHKFHINLPPDSNVVLQQFPSYFQLFQRNAKDSAIIPVKGYVQLPGYDSVVLKLYKNDSVLVQRQVSYLTYSFGIANFSFKPRIHAEETEYKIELYLKNSTKDTLVAMQYNLTCGDVYILSGQSNTVEGDNASMYFNNEYCRSFGGPSGSSMLYGTDTFWGYASGFNIEAYDVGGWGYRLMQYIHDSIHIPVAFIDGGLGGTTIAQNMRNMSYPTDLNTIYGRLLYRMRKSGLDTLAKALFWYQGESEFNGGGTYYNSFKALYTNWMRDYPALKKVYVMQIHTGCFKGPNWRLREIQRNLKDSLPNIETMSMMGTTGHDGCHYNSSGYEDIGLKMWRLVNRDFYHGKDTLHIRAPDIERAFYRDSTRTSIGLLFKDRDTGLYWTADTFVWGYNYNIKDAFYLDDSGGRVKRVWMNKDTLILTLDSAAHYKKVTYLPDHYYQKSPVIYEGPWLMNRRNIGAFSFYGISVMPFARPKVNFSFTHLCYRDSTLFKDSSGILYNKLVGWKWIFDDSTVSTERNPTHVFAKDSFHKVKLIVTAELNRTDSIEKQLYIIPLPDAQFKWKDISATRVLFTPDDTTGLSYEWNFGDSTYSNRIKRIYIYPASGKYGVTLTVHKNGCVNSYTDSVTVYDAATNNISSQIPLLSIFPNPFSDKLALEIATQYSGLAIIKIMDLVGNTWLNTVFEMREGKSNDILLNTANLPPGVYIMQITAGNNIVTKSIVKVN